MTMRFRCRSFVRRSRGLGLLLRNSIDILAFRDSVPAIRRQSSWNKRMLEEVSNREIVTSIFDAYPRSFRKDTIGDGRKVNAQAKKPRAK